METGMGIWEKWRSQCIDCRLDRCRIGPALHEKRFQTDMGREVPPDPRDEQIRIMRAELAKVTAKLAEVRANITSIASEADDLRGANSDLQGRLAKVTAEYGESIDLSIKYFHRAEAAEKRVATLEERHWCCGGLVHDGHRFYCDRPPRD